MDKSRNQINVRQIVMTVAKLCMIGTIRSVLTALKSVL